MAVRRHVLSVDTSAIRVPCAAGRGLLLPAAATERPLWCRSVENPMTYNTLDYFSVDAYEAVRAAHRSLVGRYRPGEMDSVTWYWNRPGALGDAGAYHREEFGPFTLHSGPMVNLPLELVAIFLDSQVKTYMDRDALGEAVRPAPRNGTPHDDAATIAARERELARRIGGGSLQSTSLLMAVVEHRGYVLGGMIVNPGKTELTIAEVMQAPSTTSIAAFQAKFSLPPGDPFLSMKENAIIDLVRYFRAPDHVLRKTLPSSLLERSAYRKAAHLIRALTISEAFAVTARWAGSNRRVITTCVCETPNDDVKALIEGKRLRRLDGSEVKVGAIPHRILTCSTGAELYPVAYQNRPEGQSKIYTLYTFDFEDIAARAREYRQGALAAYAQGEAGDAA